MRYAFPQLDREDDALMRELMNLDDQASRINPKGSARKAMKKLLSNNDLQVVDLLRSLVANHAREAQTT